MVECGRGGRDGLELVAGRVEGAEVGGDGSELVGERMAGGGHCGMCSHAEGQGAVQASDWPHWFGRMSWKPESSGNTWM